MKILLVNKFWFLKGGAERVLFDTKKLLEDAGHVVEVFGMSDKKNIFKNKYFIENIDYRKVKGFKKLKVAKNFIWNVKAKENFRKLIREFKPDVVHFHNIYHQLSYSLVDVVHEEEIPSVMTLHDYKLISPNYNLFHHGKIGEECLGGKYYQCFLKNCLENLSWSFVAVLEVYYRKFRKIDMYINMYISPSKFLKNKFIENGFIGKSIRVLHNPVKNIEIKKNSYGEDVLYFGRLSKEKGVDVLLQSAKYTPKIKYLIAGSGPEKENLQKFVKDNKIKNVEFLGFLAKDELNKEIKKARLVIVPSIWYEVFGLSVVEALSCSKVVLGSNLGAIPELLPKELLFKPNNPKDLAKSVNLWYNKSFKELKEVGLKLKKEANKKGNSDKYLKDLLSIYEKIQKL